MIITKTLVHKFKLADLEALDPVQVIAEDLGLGRGQITVSCFGKSWTSYWGGMGPQKIIEFVTTCNIDYLAEKFSTVSKFETDWDKINEDIFGEDRYALGHVDETTAYQYDEELGAQYGECGDWRLNLPQRVTTEYAYLCRIIRAMRDGFRQIREEAA